MKNSFFVLFLVLGFNFFASAQEAEVGISLSPAGSFKVKSSKVTGTAAVKGNDVSAENIVVDLTEIETGIGVRNEHTKKHLEVEKYPTATLISATGSGGKGHGRVKIHNIESDVDGTYEIKDNKLMAEFNIVLSKFGITNIKYMGVGVKDEATIRVTVPLTK
jgi:polyisoprenoid-binding protein YceI